MACAKVVREEREFDKGMFIEWKKIRGKTGLTHDPQSISLNLLLPASANLQIFKSTNLQIIKTTPFV